MTHHPARIGIIGAGTIATTILESLRESGLGEVIYMLVTEGRMARTGDPYHRLYTTDIAHALALKADLVIEAATTEIYTRLAPRILADSDFCGFSCTALADAETMDAVIGAAERSGHRCHVPHGAVLGLDGLADGRDIIDTVTITTRKSGKSLGRAEDAAGLLYEGPARGACVLFPRNVNVHAAVALAGIGFDRTVSRIIAVPGQQDMEHRIEVSGRGLSWDLLVTSMSLGGVTGAYTPMSAVGSVHRILSGKGLSIV